MREVIDGLIYDTNKSTCVYSGRSNTVKGYRTNKGNWFLVEDRDHNHYLKAMSEEGMKNYLHKNNGVDALEKYFPDSVSEA